MTCIVGYVGNNGVVYVGGDSAGSNGVNQSIRADEKVFNKGEMVFGFTTSFRMGQLLRYRLEIPSRRSICSDTGDISDFEYLCTSFMDNVITCFEEAKFSQKTNERISGGLFLVGYRGHIYRVESDFQVSHTLDNYSACGAGEDFALGSFRVLEQYQMEPKERLTRVLEASAHLCTSVRGPFNIVNTADGTS